MLDNLTQSLQKSFKKLMGQGKITESNIKSALEDIRTALVSGDVAVTVIDILLEKIAEKAQGQEVLTSVSPGQTFVKIVQDELTAILGHDAAPINFKAAPPVIILMAGLQGSGKTTTVAKLARRLKEKDKKSVLVASCDIYRPAAIEQLKTLANDLNINFFPSDATQKPVDIANNAIKEASKTFMDVVIIDTAGRLHVDEDMMSEIKQIAHSIKPHETLFVVDSMTGQDAANTAKAFNDALPLTGIVLTKTDGDARLGAALSIHHITQKPIKFLGTGEKTDALELFDPKRVASRILGMGDIVGLVEHAQEKINAKDAEKFAKKMVSGGQFTLDDFAAQLEQMAKMGDLSSLLSKVPGMGQMVEAAKHKIPEAEKSLKKNLALIRSMTPNERIFPAKIANQPSRKRRIVNGAGLQAQDLSALLKQFEKMQATMKKMKGGGMMKMMQKMQGMMGNGGFPPMG